MRFEFLYGRAEADAIVAVEVGVFGCCGGSGEYTVCGCELEDEGFSITEAVAVGDAPRSIQVYSIDNAVSGFPDAWVPARRKGVGEGALVLD